LKPTRKLQKHAFWLWQLAQSPQKSQTRQNPKHSNPLKPSEDVVYSKLPQLLTDKKQSKPQKPPLNDPHNVYFQPQRNVYISWTCICV